MKPVTIAEIEKRKKKLEPTRPNWLGVRPSSCMIGTPARPMTVLSTKLISMKAKRRKTTTQALLPDTPGIFSSPRPAFWIRPASTLSAFISFYSMAGDHGPPDKQRWLLNRRIWKVVGERSEPLQHFPRMLIARYRLDQLVVEGLVRDENGTLGFQSCSRRIEVARRGK